MTSAEWEDEVAAAWARLDEVDEHAFRDLVDDVATRAPDDAGGAADFERACARDSTGRPDLAVPLYAAALERGLVGLRRRRATIQMASSLRNLGEPDRALALLEEEARRPDELADAVVAFRALTLADLGRERDALALVLTALAPHLPRYERSVANYARLLTEPG